VAMNAISRVPIWGTGAERTDRRVPAYVPNRGIRLPPWVFDGEALADRLCRLKFERAREMGDLFHEAPSGGNSAIHTQRSDQAEALTTLKLARQLGVWFRRTLAGRFPAGAS
jgi:hypothetical protein